MVSLYIDIVFDLVIVGILSIFTLDVGFFGYGAYRGAGDRETISIVITVIVALKSILKARIFYLFSKQKMNKILFFADGVFDLLLILLAFNIDGDYADIMPLIIPGFIILKAFSKIKTIKSDGYPLW